MCGIAGIISNEAEDSRHVVARMLGLMRHRGPDNESVWVGQGVAFGHVRLSVIDLSADANQPFFSDDRRYAIVFNGEIYNFAEIRTVLKKCGHRFRTSSDTEVLLAAFREWGKNCLHKLNGMFAFAVWDSVEKRLFLARDRIGVKPLYYTTSVIGQIAFSSELLPLACYLGSDTAVSVPAVSELLWAGYVRGPDTLIHDVFKLLPGTSLEFFNGETKLSTYWSPPVCDRPIRHSQKEFEALIEDAIRLRLVSDVPVGLFLSGGLDSTVLALMLATRLKAPIVGYTVRYPGSSRDEGEDAALTARVLGMEHREVLMADSDAQWALQRMRKTFDEPSGDTSAVSTLLVAEFASRDVKVVISGDGADEVLLGYSRLDLYDWLNRWRRRKLAAACIGAVLPRDHLMAQRLASAMSAIGLFRGKSAADKLLRIAGFLSAKTIGARYQELFSTSPRLLIEQLLVSMPDIRPRWAKAIGVQHGAVEGCDRAAWTHDFSYYLPDSILMKLDRATMSVSIEGREPYLDHRLVEYGLSLSGASRRMDRNGKLPLRAILAASPVNHVLNRPKRGFGTPMELLRSSIGGKDGYDLTMAFFASIGLSVNTSALKRIFTPEQQSARDFIQTAYVLENVACWAERLDEVSRGK